MALLLPLILIVVLLAIAKAATSTCQRGDYPAIDQHGYRTTNGWC